MKYIRHGDLGLFMVNELPKMSCDKFYKVILPSGEELNYHIKVLLEVSR